MLRAKWGERGVSGLIQRAKWGVRGASGFVRGHRWSLARGLRAKGGGLHTLKQAFEDGERREMGRYARGQVKGQVKDKSGRATPDGD